MNHRLIGAVLTCAMAAGSANAGLKQEQLIVVNLVDRTASGALGTAFNTTGRTEQIGCYLHYYAEDSVSAVCEAIDAFGTRGSCITSDANLIAAVRALNGDSVLTFAWTVTEGTRQDCTRITVNNSSYTAPKK